MIKKSCSISLWKWSAISAVGLFLVGCSQNQESVEPVFTQEEIDSQSDSITELSVESPKPVVEKSKNESVSSINTNSFVEEVSQPIVLTEENNFIRKKIEEIENYPIDTQENEERYIQEIQTLIYAKFLLFGDDNLLVE